jgi:hypothetical protein
MAELRQPVRIWESESSAYVDVLEAGAFKSNTYVKAG